MFHVLARDTFRDMYRVHQSLHSACCENSAVNIQHDIKDCKIMPLDVYVYSMLYLCGDLYSR